MTLFLGRRISDRPTLCNPSMSCVQPCYTACYLLQNVIIYVCVLSLNFNKQINMAKHDYIEGKTQLSKSVAFSQL